MQGQAKQLLRGATVINRSEHQIANIAKKTFLQFAPLTVLGQRQGNNLDTDQHE